MTFILFLSFFILLVMNVPIAFSLFISSTLALIYGGIPLVAVVQRAVTATDSFVLLAIPFFMFAGNLMGAGGISNRLIQLADASVGWIKGGLAHVNVLTSMMFAGITGSAVADTSSEGTIIIPAMKKAGYDADFSVGVTCCSSVIGVIIPPSIPFVLYGVVTGVSIGKLFLGGFIPGILVGLSQMAISYYLAKKHNYGTITKFSFRNLYKNFISSFFAIIMPLVIVGGISFGIVTPTEAAILATVYALILGFFVYKELNLEMMPKLLLDSVKMTAIVMFMIAGAYMYGWVITNDQIPQKIVQLVSSFTSSPQVVLIMLVVVYLITGMFLDLGAAIILLCPIFFPLTQAMGIDPLFFGIVTVISLAIGLVTPPVGACLFIACKIGDVPLMAGAKASLPFILAIVGLLILFILFPQIVLALPNALL